MSAGEIHPTAVVSPRATIGHGVVIGPHAVVYDCADIADNVWIGAGSIIGAPAEIRGRPHFAWPQSTALDLRTRIGVGTVIREHCVIGQGNERDTVIGRDGYVMNAAYIAHDCVVSDDVTLASGVRLAGHVWVGRGANLGLNVSVHQRRRIGGGVMIGMGSVITRDIPPFAKAYGDPARVAGANAYRLSSLGVSQAQCVRIAATLLRDQEITSDTVSVRTADILALDLTEWVEQR